MWLIHMRKFLFVFVSLFGPSRYIFGARIDEEFCGFEQKCTGNKTTIEKTNVSCCQPCECADVCKERDTCCTDKEVLDDNEEVFKQECLPAAHMPEGLLASINAPHYYTRTRCPKTFQNLRIKEKCENEIPESLEDITSVSSNDGTVVYKNKFCGLCHGEKRTVPWKLGVPDCIYLLSNQDATLAKVAKTLLSHCTIILIEPDNLELKHTICFKRPITSQCNQTGEWELYDSELEDLCRRPPVSLYYYKITPWRYIVYRSVYCYLCNTKANAAPETCEEQNRNFFPYRSITSLINADAWTSSKGQEGKSNTCTADQILDTFFNVCRQLFCPKFFVPVNGACIPFLDTKTNYPLVVRLVPQEPVNKTDAIKEELMSRYVSVQRQLGLGRCKLCVGYIYLRRDINETLLLDITMRFALTATEKCKLEYLVSKLNYIEMTPSKINIRLNEKMVRFDVLWENINWLSRDRFEEIMLYRNVATNCPTFSQTPASNCAKLRLTTEEYQTVLTNHVFANELLFAPIQEDMNGTVFVCRDKYILNPRSASVRNRFKIAFVLFTLIMTSTLKSYTCT